MSNSVMTDEALEQELTKILRRHHYTPTAKDIGDVWENRETDVVDTTGALKLLLPLIKSYAREYADGIIGEDEPLDVQSDFDKLGVPHKETDRYPGLDGVRQASRNLLRQRQRLANTKEGHPNA